MTVDQSSPIGANSVQELKPNQEKNTYKQQLKDDRWYDKRLVIIAKADYKCQNCGYTGKLDVHHLYYIKGKKMWQYPNKALVALCRDCHTKWHENNRLEYREEVWSSLKEYQPPKNRKIYIVKKGGKSVYKERPYKKHKVIGCATHPLTPLEKAKRRIRKRGICGGKFRKKIV
jgi:hypothetical protein